MNSTSYLDTASDELRLQEGGLELASARRAIAAGATFRLTFGGYRFDRWPPIRGPPRPSLER